MYGGGTCREEPSYGQLRQQEHHNQQNYYADDRRTQERWYDRGNQAYDPRALGPDEEVEMRRARWQ